MSGPRLTRVDAREPTPGDIGRFALHVEPTGFANQVARWCSNDVEINDVANWLETVARQLRKIRASL